ncbi:response regulator transcription factor [uncultured Treponema sp.]|uniref:response regulator transcription factor n=1 Tax=uncultured Treponema sp. TaxID=162155 RepID=UPI0025DC0D5D|nr:response regulator transcription factor [uncultured Treponema sp.]
MAEESKKILIVEDDKGISDFVIPELEHEGFRTVLAETGRQALEKFDEENPDLILLDVMLPELNGLEVLRRIRAKSNVPIILETARGETIDKINGLNSGADDYIPKPFEIEELLARINALFRRINSMKPAESSLSVRSLKLNTDRMSFSINENEIPLSKTEFLMLKNFIENMNKVLSRADIIDAIWGKGHFIDENTVDVYVGYLRSKIAEHTKEEFIKTVRGAGYMLV